MPDFPGLAQKLDFYFPDTFSGVQMLQFEQAFGAYREWNEKINLISRKDIENLGERHFLHSLGISKSIRFLAGTSVLDAGTGGGFPGIPLAIAFPEVNFHLVDSIGKKIKVAEEIARAIHLKNVQFSVQRVEQLPEQYDFVVARAVSELAKFLPLIKGRVHCKQINSLKNGLLYLKGGEVEPEIKAMGKTVKGYKLIALSDCFEEPFFSTKYLVHIPFCK